LTDIWVKVTFNTCQSFTGVGEAASHSVDFPAEISEPLAGSFFGGLDQFAGSFFGGFDQFTGSFGDPAASLNAVFGVLAHYPQETGHERRK